MRLSFRFTVAALLVVALSASIALCTVPQIIHFQGVLEDDQGTLLDGTYSVTFSIYDQESGGSALWSEMRDVDCDAGLFSVLLGQNTPVLLDFDAQCWLGVQVTGDPEMTPRYQSASVPYAYWAASSDSSLKAAQADVADWALAADVSDSANGVLWQNIGGVPPDILDGDDVGGAGDGYSLDAADGSPVDALYVDNFGNVGIATTSPAQKLHVQSDARVDGTLTISGFQMQSGASNGHVLTSDGSGTGTWQAAGGGGDSDWTISGNDMYSAVSGNVGIGTASPGADSKLHVKVPATGNLDRITLECPAADNGFGIEFKQPSSSWYVGQNVGNQSDDRFSISNDYGDQYRLVILRDGKTGIGTTSPGATVDIKGSGSHTYLLSVADSTYSNVLRVTSGGDMGIGGITPAAKLHVWGTVKVGLDGMGDDVTFYGDDTGGMLYWNEDRMALRAGLDIDGTHWAQDSTGKFSMAAGSNVRAVGDYSAALGSSTRARGGSSFAAGGVSKAFGDYSTALGGWCTARGNFSMALGENATATETGAYAIGSYVTASGSYARAFGRYVQANSASSFVIGTGTGYGSELTSYTANSLMIGFNSDIPTLFVGPSSGTGTTGKVGIGTSTPDNEAKLEIQCASDNFGILVNSDNTSGSEIGLHAANSRYSGLVKNAYFDSGWFRFDPSDGAFLQEITPTGDTRLRVTPSGAGMITWTEMLYLKSNGNVGIGTTAPGYRLQVGNAGDGSQARANAWNLLSSEEYKTDVRAFDQSDYQDALEKLSNTDVVKYRFVHDDAEIEHVGVIAEHSPEEILAADGKAVSLGDYTSFLLAAVKAQQGQMEEMQREIDELRSQVEGH